MSICPTEEKTKRQDVQLSVMDPKDIKDVHLSVMDSNDILLQKVAIFSNIVRKYEFLNFFQLSVQFYFLLTMPTAPKNFVFLRNFRMSNLE